MTAATVIIPVHQHAEPLRYAIDSVLNQSLQEFEIFLVGDGVKDATRRVINELLPTDSRLRFFDFPKGPRKGEVHWHRALQEAKGRFVAYLGSDDCWLPNHLAVLDELLTDADFGHTLHLSVSEEQIIPLAADLENPGFRNRMLTELFNRFDFSFGGHTVAAYRRLPKNWASMPPDFPFADLYLWRQFIAEPWCRARSACVPTGINTATSSRPELSDTERAEELAYWYRQFTEPAFRERLWREVTQRFASQSVGFELETRALEGRLARLKKPEEQLEQANSRIHQLEHERAATAFALAELKRSTSWRVTWPLRQIRLITTRLLVKTKNSQG